MEAINIRQTIGGQLLTIKTAATLLETTPYRLKKAIGNGEVEVTLFGGEQWVSLTEVRRLLGVFAGDPHAFDHLSLEDLLARVCP